MFGFVVCGGKHFDRKEQSERTIMKSLKIRFIGTQYT